MDEKWKHKLKSELSEEQYAVIVEKGTEAPFSGKLNDLFQNGQYFCRGCGTTLFESHSKFDSGCGWPSFDRQVSDQAVVTQPDHTLGRIRTEILCGNCGGHLGHVFDDGPTETGQRYCVNSLSIKFKSDEE